MSEGRANIKVAATVGVVELNLHSNGEALTSVTVKGVMIIIAMYNIYISDHSYVVLSYKSYVGFGD